MRRSASFPTVLLALCAPVLLVVSLALPGPSRGLGAAQATPDATPEASPEGTPPPPFPAVPVDALLPTEFQLPAGLAPERSGERTLEQMAYVLAGRADDPAARAAAAERLRGWGWAAGAERQYRPAEGAEAVAGGIRWLWVVNSRFAGPEEAAGAFAALTDAARATDRLEGVGLEAGGDQARALGGGADGLFHLWLRFGTDVVWVGGTAAGGYPRAELAALAGVIGQNAVEAPVGELAVGASVATAEGANLRAAPSTEAAVVTVLAPGTTLTVIGPAEAAEGRDWYPVQETVSGLTGYIAAELLVPVG